MNQVGTLLSAGPCVSVCPGRAPGPEPPTPSCERSRVRPRGLSELCPPCARGGCLHSGTAGTQEPPGRPQSPRACGQAQPGSSSPRREGVRVYVLDSPPTSLPAPQSVLSFHLLWLKCVPHFSRFQNCGSGFLTSPHPRFYSLNILSSL